MTPSWYDVLGVAPDADAGLIRERFKAEIADLDPTDRRFRMLSRAAEVLLDPTRRAQHDAELAAQDAEDAEDADSWVDLTKEPAAAAVATDSATRTAKPTKPAKPAKAARPARPPRPATADGGRGLLATTVVLGLLALLLATATVVSLVRADDAGSAGSRSSGSGDDSGLPDLQDVAAARAAAVAGIVPVLSYDYRHLQQDSQEARPHLTDAAANEYLQYVNGVVLDNAKRNKVVVQASVLASGVYRTGEDRVDVLLFVDQAVTNTEVTTPETTKNQVLVQMYDQDGTWLVGCLKTTPDGPCPE